MRMDFPGIVPNWCLSATEMRTFCNTAALQLSAGSAIGKPCSLPGGPCCKPVCPACVSSPGPGSPALAALAAPLCAPVAALAQDAALPPAQAPEPTSPGRLGLKVVDPQAPIAFEADRVEYRQDDDAVIASGNVLLRQNDRSLRTDSVTWDRNTGKIYASGNVRMVDEDGNQLYTDKLELTDEFETGAMEKPLIALREGGRLAARTGQRLDNGDVVLTHAAYSPCEIETLDGCPKTPSWRITAGQVVYDEDTRLIRFRNARLELFGLRLLPLPGLSITTDGRATSGLLPPDFSSTPSNGIEISQGWYQRLGPNCDILARAYIYTDAPPMLSGQYRALSSKGAYQITGYATGSQRVSVGSGTSAAQWDFRGDLYANLLATDPGVERHRLDPPRDRPHLPVLLRSQPR